jgi:hypothetical protein
MSIRLLALGLLCLGAAGQPKGGQFCGGLAAIRCPEGLTCVDDPNDYCGPIAGGRDCGGICVDPDKSTKPQCEEEQDPRLSYILRDPDECLAIDVRCPEGSTAFFNDCGCGCQNSVEGS